MQELRSLIVEIHPPILANEGLAPALSDLVSPLAARNIVATLDVDAAIDPNPEIAKLLFRGAQEAIRNVLKHSGAQTVAVSVAESGGRVRLTVDDDGRGIDPAMRAKREENGHVGLGLLRALTMDLGGSLDVTASKAGGTRLTLELPAR
jgi:signal transduction histidine kinase